MGEQNKPTVYVETTIISYLTARPSRDVVLLGQQEQTRQWWIQEKARFDLVCSELVQREASAGDPAAAAERMKIIQALPLLALTADAAALARKIILEVGLPRRAQADAFHVAIATTNGIDYLVTWNCRHLTNIFFRPKIEQVCIQNGLRPPLICAPPDLMEP